MDPKLRILLKKIGFSEKEVLAYLSLLRLGGSQPVNLIAQKSGLNRSTTYHTLSSLVHRGMVSTFLKEKVSLKNTIGLVIVTLGVLLLSVSGF